MAWATTAPTTHYAHTPRRQPGIGTKDDEVRAVVTQDSDGHPLNGANRYVIHFASNQLPPVRGFWSITAYTRDGALGESAPARIAVGDRTARAAIATDRST